MSRLKVGGEFGIHEILSGVHCSNPGIWRGVPAELDFCCLKYGLITVFYGQYGLASLLPHLKSRPLVIDQSPGWGGAVVLDKPPFTRP
jgi:hypothetical protein